MSDEQWKPVVGEEGKYEVSNLGDVRSIDRVVVSSNGAVRKLKGKRLKPFFAKRTAGWQIALTGHIKHSLHRVVAKAFCEGYFEGAVVNHINGNRDDNRAVNLEWCTQSHNCKHAYQRGRVNPFSGKTGKDHPVSKSVVGKDLVTGEEKIYQSLSDAVRDGFQVSRISSVCKGKSAHHKGHTWRYANDNDIAERDAS